MSRLSSFIRRTRRDAAERWFLCDGLMRATSGVASEARKIPVVVSLTTTAERLPKTVFAVECLLRQTVKPDRLVLWLDQKLEPLIPAWLQWQTRRGLEIRLIHDVGPHTKIFYALKEFVGTRIVTADDDVWYPNFWLEELLTAHERAPDCITCHRAHRMTVDENGRFLPYKQWDWLAPSEVGPSLWLFPTGVSGVLYPPNALHPEVGNAQVFQQLCPTADDVWLKAMSLLNHTPCQKVAPRSRDWPVVRGSQQKNLSMSNVERGWNDVQLHAVFNHYKLHSCVQQFGDISDRLRPLGRQPWSAV